MFRHIRKIGQLMSICWLSFGADVHAQEGIGTVVTDNAHTVVQPGTAQLIFAERLYIGPSSNWEIHGTVEVWSKYIWIAPTAKIYGTGKLIIHGPGDNIYYDDWADSPTYVDGNNGEAIDVAIELRNPHSMRLAHIENPAYDIQNSLDATLSATLNLAGQLHLAVDGAHLFLQGNDLNLGASAAIVDYGPRRYIVTDNAIAGHLVKTFTNAQPFVYPVGIEAGDYTPATLLPVGNGVLAVSVQDYATADATIDDRDRGMGRIWHIVADKGIQATYTLQHNTITNGHTYVDENAEIVQYAGGGNWIGGATQRLTEGVHERVDLRIADDSAHPGSWFTKLSPIEGPRAVDDKATVESGSRVDILVLENDYTGRSPLVVGKLRIKQLPAHGIAYVNPDGSVTYTPNSGFVGPDYLVYMIADESGLTSEATVTITVSPRPLHIPNVFTPNNDGQNDVFEIEGIEGIARMELTVVNRWGNEVYRSNDYKNDWNGGSLSEGTYFYEIIAHKDGERKRYSGWVLIKRI